MKALRRVTRADEQLSDLLKQMTIQTYMGAKAGTIDPKIADSIMEITQRMHAGLVIRTGIIDRIKQKRFNARHPMFRDTDLAISLVCLAAFAAVLGLAWVVI
jgi:hypothetical protein